MKRDWQGKGKMHKQAEMTMITLQRSLRHDGGTPSMFLDTLADTIENETWVELGLTFREMLEREPPEGVGTTVEAIKKVVDLKHKFEDIDPAIRKRMTWLREQVGRLLDVEVGDNGTNQYNRVCGPQTLNYQGNDTTYIRARLKRDNPGLYESVVKNEISATAAGQKAGFVPKRQKFVVGDVEQTARQIKKYFNQNQITEIIALLQT